MRGAGGGGVGGQWAGFLGLAVVLVGQLGVVLVPVVLAGP